tara:strand:+ start:7427 stop:7957 length:531 start_codon:yes stop_codon:yes gene_type:complete
MADGPKNAVFETCHLARFGVPMRLLLPNVLTDEMVESLLTTHTREHIHRNDAWDTGVMPDLCQIVTEHIPAKVGGNAYFRVETRSAGHTKHYDGCKLDKTPNHMPWCKWSAVSLLTPPSSFSGGEFSFFDPEEVYREELHRSLLLYSSGADNDPQLHQAARHWDGRRTMLLMFFEG